MGGVMNKKQWDRCIILLLTMCSFLFVCGFVPYEPDSNTVLIDHLDGATNASILAYSETGAACGTAKPLATPSSAYVAGPVGLGQAISLNPPEGEPEGSSTYLRYPGGQLLSQANGTIEFWIYLTSYGTGMSLVAQGPYPGSCAGWTFGMGVSATGQLQAGAWAAFNMNSGATTVPLNAWTHVAATWGSTGAKLYINGELVGGDTNTGMPASGYNGNVMVNYNARVVTRIDELRISNLQRTRFEAGNALYAVDVKHLSYMDDSGRQISYDFSAGTVESNAINLSALTDVVTHPTGEAAGTAYFWGQTQGIPPVTVTLDTAGGKATINPTTEGSEGIAVLYASAEVLPAGTDPVSWFYSLELGNFNVDLNAQKAYRLEMGLARDGDGYNQAFISVIWVKGYYDGTLYSEGTLIIEAKIENTDNDIWKSEPIVRAGLDPAATTLMFDLSVENGTILYASVAINDEGMQNLTGENGYTLTAQQGQFLRFPDLFPFIYMEEEIASTVPQAQVQTIHVQNDGNYYVNFYVQDPLHLASAVRVTGASYVGSGVDLVWNDAYGGSWIGTEGYLIGATPDLSWPAFTFTFTSQAGGDAIDPVTKNITGYVTEFATNLQPSGSISSLTGFSWTACQGASGYGVELNEGGTRIWDCYNLSSVRTAVPYNGPALENGKTYDYNINSFVEQNGVWNMSMANGSFTYSGGTAETISFNGWAKTIPSWPLSADMAAVAGVTVSAFQPGTTPTLIGTAVPDSSTGAFTIAEIPVSTTFFLNVQPPAGYAPVLSKFMNWTADIQALLPYALFTTEQYDAFGNTAGTGMIVGRVAMEESPSTFLSGATIAAMQFLDGAPTGTAYPVTYTGGGTGTGSDGIYMVKDVPAGTMVQLVVSLSGYGFDFNGAVVPAQAGFISEESFFGRPAQSQSPFTVYSYHAGTNYYINMFVNDSTHAFTGVTVNGPGLAGELLLGYITERGRWEIYAAIDLGTTPPTEALTYAFTAETGGTPVVVSKTVSVYVAEFATDLEPAGDVTTANPTFSWTGITGATGYEIFLEDMTAGSWLWSGPEMEAGQTSIVYDGPALVAGHTYRYTVISLIETDGNPNSSFAESEFTFTGAAPTITTFTSEAAFTAAVIPMKLINFEDRDASAGRISFAGNEYAGEGITFSTPNSQPMWIYPPTSGYWNSNHLSPGEAPYESGDANEDSLTLIFNPAVNAIGWTFIDYGGTGGERIRVYGEDNSLIYENTDLSVIAGGGVGQGNNPFWGLASPNMPIARVEIVEAANDGDDVAYDNFRFSPVGQSITTTPIAGAIKDSAGTTGIDGVTVEQVGAEPANSTMSSGGGLYNLAVPSGVPFYLKFSKADYVPTYSAMISVSGGAAVELGDFTLFPLGQLDTWNVTFGQGIIRARIKDEAGNYVGGATVTAFSRKYSSNSSYQICYNDACTLDSTDGATGRFIVKNVDPGDTITVTAEKEGWTFKQRVYTIAADAIHQGGITGSPILSATGQTFDTAEAGTGSVTVSVQADVSWTAVSNESWIHITSGAAGKGSGSVSYTLDANTGEARTGTMTIAGETFTVNQAGAGSSTVTVSGFVRDWNGAVIAAPGVTVSLAGNASTSTTSSTTDGTFSLAGVPANTPFALKFSRTGYMDLYSVDITLTADTYINGDAYGGYSPFTMFTSGNLEAMGVMPDEGKSLIAGRVSDLTYRYAGTVGGAVVTATSELHPAVPYSVVYRDPFGVLGGGATWGNGRFYVLNVDDGDRVTVNAFRNGWSFGIRTFGAVGDAVTEGRIWGVAPGYDASISGSVRTFAGAGVPGATLALHGDPGKFTTTAGDGSYSFGGLPRDAYLYVKVTASGYVPVFAGPANLPGGVSGVNLFMATAAEMTGFGVTGGNGLLGCTVMNQSMNPLSGATVTLTSRSGTAYSVLYEGGGSTTSASGRFLVPNVAPGDVVKIETTASGYAFNPVYLDGFGGAVTEKMILETGQAPYSVDVKHLSYSDDSGRQVSYDFSAGTVANDAINLSSLADVVTQPTGESTATTYFWGQAPGLPPANVTLDTEGGKATIKPAVEGAEGVTVLYSSPEALPAGADPASWFYSLELANFNIDLNAQKAYRLEMGLGSDSDGYNEAHITVTWVKGYCDGVLYADNTLIIQGEIQNSGNQIWGSDPIVRTGLDPTTTTLMFDLSVENGNTLYASVAINGEGMQNLTGETGQTLAEGQFLRFPDLFPFIYMEEKIASTVPQAQVQTMHFQSDGKYYVSFYVQDPLHMASAVRVTGPSYVGSGIDLIWNEEGRNWYSQGCLIGATPDLSWPAFTFTFTPQTGGDAIDPVTKNIAGYVSEFATNLQPLGSISSLTDFSWTGISGASGYGVELNDGSGTRVWNSYNIPGTQTSVSYDGPALIHGMTYTYMISTGIEQNGAWNMSFASGSFTYTGSASTVAVSGFVRDWNGAVIAAPGVTVSLAGNASTSTTSSTTDGTFSLAGVPANAPFALKFSRTGYMDLYSVDITLTADTYINGDAYGGSSPFTMFTSGNLEAMGVMPDEGKSLIAGRVSDLTYRYAGTVGGAVVTATSELHPAVPYSVVYRDPFGVLGGNATYGNGHFYVLNVDAGDRLTITAARDGWSFWTRTFRGEESAVTQGRIWGTAPGYDASISGSVRTFAGAGISGATLALHGDPGKFTTTAGGGSYSFGGLPRDACLYVKVTASGYVPVFAGPANLPGGVSGVNLFMATAAEMTGFGVTGSNGLLGCTVMDQSMNPLSGATVTLTSRSGTAYSVLYEGGGSTTSASGRFLVPNVAPGDVVGIEVMKSGYVFDPVYLNGFGGAITEKMILAKESAVLKGDLNGDSVVDLADAILALKVMAGVPSEWIRPDYVTSGADVNGNGKIGLAEAVYILQKIASLRP